MKGVLIKRPLRNNFVNKAKENFITVSCHFQQLFLPNNDRPTYRRRDDKLDCKLRTKTCPLPTPNFSLFYSTDLLVGYQFIPIVHILHVYNYVCVYHVNKSVSLLQSA